MKIIGLSIVAGIGFAIVGFVLGAIITAILLYAVFEIGSSTCFEGCGLIIMGFSPIMGLLMASIIGVDGGRRMYKRLSKKND